MHTIRQKNLNTYDRLTSKMSNFKWKKIKIGILVIKFFTEAYKLQISGENEVYYKQIKSTLVITFQQKFFQKD